MNDGYCLRYPENLPIQRELNLEAAVTFLMRGIEMGARVPFIWSAIDKPVEGQLFLIFLPSIQSYPVDGIRYQEQENKFIVSGGPGREIEVSEIKYGFVPGMDNVAWRYRRRFRLVKGGHPQLVLVHYGRVPSPSPINPALMHQPVRAYPIRPSTEPPVYVLGEKAGQKGPPPMGVNMNMGMVPPQPGMNMMPAQQQALLAQQNGSMEMLERRREQERSRQRNMAAATRPPHPVDDDSGDELEQISTRSLALARYKRNHELMNEVFAYASYKMDVPSHPSPFSIFNHTELEEKESRLKEELASLKAKSEERKLLSTTV